MKSNTSNLISAIVLASAIALLALVLSFNHSPKVLGSTGRGSEYQGTTTQATVGAFPTETALQTGPGTLGSVTITGATTGTINIYDATTSNTIGRNSTSSLLVASFPASTAAGTYTFDRVLFNGLYIVTTGTMPTSTITFR